MAADHRPGIPDPHDCARSTTPTRPPTRVCSPDTTRPGNPEDHRQRRADGDRGVSHHRYAQRPDTDGTFGLSVTQIAASTAAAVTAALIGSRLGVAGTLTGASIASIVSGVGAAATAIP